MRDGNGPSNLCSSPSSIKCWGQDGENIRYDDAVWSTVCCIYLPLPPAGLGLCPGVRVGHQSSQLTHFIFLSRGLRGDSQSCSTWRPSPPPPPSPPSAFVSSLPPPSPPARRGGGGSCPMRQLNNPRICPRLLQGNIGVPCGVQLNISNTFSAVTSSLAWRMSTRREPGSSWSTGWPPPPPQCPLCTRPPAPSDQSTALQPASLTPFAGNRFQILVFLLLSYQLCFLMSIKK